jgi:hypothetical protein
VININDKIKWQLMTKSVYHKLNFVHHLGVLLENRLFEIIFCSNKNFGKQMWQQIQSLWKRRQLLNLYFVV